MTKKYSEKSSKEKKKKKRDLLYVVINKITIRQTTTRMDHQNWRTQSRRPQDNTQKEKREKDINIQSYSIIQCLRTSTQLPENDANFVNLSSFYLYSAKTQIAMIILIAAHANACQTMRTSLETMARSFLLLNKSECIWKEETITILGNPVAGFHWNSPAKWTYHALYYKIICTSKYALKTRMDFPALSFRL